MKKLYITALLFLFAGQIFAQGGPPPPPGVPIDTHISWLLPAAIIFIIFFVIGTGKKKIRS
jgi:hypothetical protein